LELPQHLINKRQPNVEVDFSFIGTQHFIKCLLNLIA